MRRAVLLLSLMLWWSGPVFAQETPGNLGIWKPGGVLGSAGNATAPGNLAVDGNLVVNNGLQVKGTGAPFTNPIPPLNTSSVITRLSDRLFVGKETDKYDGRSQNLWGQPNCTAAVAPFGCTWVSSPSTVTGIMDYEERNAQLLVYSEHGQNPVFFATRTSDNNEGCCAQGLATFVYNNDTLDRSGGAIGPEGYGQVAWGTYNTAVRGQPIAGVNPGSVFGTEFDVANLANEIDWYPFGGNGRMGITVPLWVACGGEMSDVNLGGGIGKAVHACTAAMGILNNGGNYGLGDAPFLKGIVFGNNALKSDGGIYHAISMPSRAELEWWTLNPAWVTDKAQPSGVIVSSIASTVTGPQHGNSLQLRDDGAHFTGPQGGTDFLVYRSPVTQYGVGDYVSVMPSYPGGDPLVLARGSDDDINLGLAAKGKGDVILHQASPHLHVHTVASLPPCGTNNNPIGTLVTVYDSSVATFDAPLAGGGGNVMIAFCGTGNIWRAH